MRWAGMQLSKTHLLFDYPFMILMVNYSVILVSVWITPETPINEETLYLNYEIFFVSVLSVYVVIVVNVLNLNYLLQSISKKTFIFQN
jgi:hypothetical protein